MQDQENTFTKYCPNVFVAKCTNEHEKGETIILTTKYGKEIENEVHNFLGKTREGYFIYSITRVDGFNAQERAKAKAEKLNGYAWNAEKRSSEYYEASHEGRDFLSLGEPIKVGHHSEKRHRALIDRNWARMGKSVDESKKAQEYQRRAEYWEAKTNDINLSMPESLDFYEYKLEQAKIEHKELKDNPEKRSHSYSLTYANKTVKETKKNLDLAVKLWGTDEEIQQINNEKEEAAKKKADKKGGFDLLIKKYGGFWFFGSDSDLFKSKYNELLKDGFVDHGEKVKHIIAGLYVPSKNADNFIKEL